MIVHAKHAVWCALALASLVGCGDSNDASSSGFVYQNQIFAGSILLQAAQSGSVERPSFSWPQTGYRHAACAIFDERIDVQRQAIVNPHRVVWIWHSGLAKGREGNVLYEQGSTDPDTYRAPDALSAGTYYWAAWVFDENGIVHASTIENTLVVP